MKYKAGDKLFFKNYSSKFIPCVVGKVLEKSGRYRVQYQSVFSSNTRYEERIVQESALFLTPKDGINSEIDQRKAQIERLQKEILELNNQKTKVTEIQEQGVVITETPKPVNSPICAGLVEFVSDKKADELIKEHNLKVLGPEDSKPEHKDVN